MGYKPDGKILRFYDFVFLQSAVQYDTVRYGNYFSVSRMVYTTGYTVRRPSRPAENTSARLPCTPGIKYLALASIKLVKLGYPENRYMLLAMLGCGGSGHTGPAAPVREY